MDRDTKLRLSSLGTTCHGVLRIWARSESKDIPTPTYIPRCLPFPRTSEGLFDAFAGKPESANVNPVCSMRMEAPAARRTDF